jgi:hypothetical protein
MPLTGRGMILDHEEELEREFDKEQVWVVYSWNYGSSGIGKAAEKSKNICYIKYSEKHHSEPWDNDAVHFFDSPVKAMAYFRVHCHDEYYTQEKVLEIFLGNFQNERANLERLLPSRFAQSPTKNTEDSEEETGKAHPSFGE